MTASTFDFALLRYSDEFIAKVTAVIDDHDTRQEAHSIEDALMRDADRAGIALASGWFENPRLLQRTR